MSQDMIELVRVSPKKCYLSGDGMWRAIISQPASFTLHIMGEDGCPYLEPIPLDNISCQLVVMVNERIRYIKPRFLSRWKSLYNFSYTITHTSLEAILSVKVNGEDVTGSPCTVALSVPVALHAMRSGPFEVMGDLDCPYSVAVLSDRKRVITELDKVCVYDHDGIKELTIGSKGDKPGQFNHPTGITVDSSNNLYIVDSGNHRIQKFSKTGDFIATIGEEGKKPLQFKNPSGICIEVVSRKVFVADTENHRIQVLNSDLTYSHMFGKKGSSQGQFNHPSDVSVSLSSFVYVADTNNNRIQVLKQDGSFIRQFGQEFTPDMCLDKPLGVAVDCMDIVIVASSQGHRVLVFDPHGNVLLVLGKLGEFSHLRRNRRRASICGGGSGEYSMPTNVTIDVGGFVYVIDSNNKRMQVYL